MALVGEDRQGPEKPRDDLIPIIVGTAAQEFCSSDGGFKERGKFPTGKWRMQKGRKGSGKECEGDGQGSASRKPCLREQTPKQKRNGDQKQGKSERAGEIQSPVDGASQEFKGADIEVKHEMITNGLSGKQGRLWREILA